MQDTGDGQDKKFAFRDGRFVNRVSGEQIPFDEPVIIFRARDWHALEILAHYHRLAELDGNPHHAQAIYERIGEFDAFKEANWGRMKQPGITRDIRLASDEQQTGGRHDAYRD